MYCFPLFIFLFRFRFSSKLAPCQCYVAKLNPSSVQRQKETEDPENLRRLFCVEWKIKRRWRARWWGRRCWFGTCLRLCLSPISFSKSTTFSVTATTGFASVQERIGWAFSLSLSFNIFHFIWSLCLVWFLEKLGWEL